MIIIRGLAVGIASGTIIASGFAKIRQSVAEPIDTALRNALRILNLGWISSRQIGLLEISLAIAVIIPGLTQLLALAILALGMLAATCILKRELRSTSPRPCGCIGESFHQAGTSSRDVLRALLVAAVAIAAEILLIVLPANETLRMTVAESVGVILGVAALAISVTFTARWRVSFPKRLETEVAADCVDSVVQLTNLRRHLLRSTAWVEANHLLGRLRKTQIEYRIRGCWGFGSIESIIAGHQITVEIGVHRAEPAIATLKIYDNGVLTIHTRFGHRIEVNTWRSVTRL